MSELTDFLLARIKEDETKARYWGPQELASDEPLWHSEIEGGGPVLIVDSARVLAECEAKRRIVGEHPVDREPHDVDYCGRCVYDDMTEAQWPCPTMRALVAVYADHPDYREEWRP